VAGAIGALGWYSGLDVYDQFGLVTPKVAHLEVADADLRSPGHDKRVDPYFFLDDEPTYLFVVMGAGRHILDGTAPYQRDLAARGLADRYAPDFAPLSPREPGGPPRFLFVIRRVPEGVASEAAWAAFRERAAQFEALP
jgi:hypothetical protein